MVGAAEIVKLAGVIDMKLNGVIEKLTDYCDDQLDLDQKRTLIARFKKEPQKINISNPIIPVAKVNVAYMPPPPEHPFMQRVAAQVQNPTSAIAGKITSPAKPVISEPNKRQSPVHPGHVKIMNMPAAKGHK